MLVYCRYLERYFCLFARVYVCVRACDYDGNGDDGGGRAPSELI